jgi:hypothetical protein
MIIVALSQKQSGFQDEGLDTAKRYLAVDLDIIYGGPRPVSVVFSTEQNIKYEAEAPRRRYCEVIGKQTKRVQQEGPSRVFLETFPRTPRITEARELVSKDSQIANSYHMVFSSNACRALDVLTS